MIKLIIILISIFIFKTEGYNMACMYTGKEYIMIQPCEIEKPEFGKY